MGLVVCFCFFPHLLNRDACYPLPLGKGEVFKPYRTLQTLLIPEATNREPNCLVVDVPVHNAAAGVQGAAPGVRSTVLRRTPPVSKVSNVDE